MKTIIISLLLFLSVNAQSVYYVDYDTTGRSQYGPYDGTTWNEAFMYLGTQVVGEYGGVTWNTLSGGDTVYISGGGSSKQCLAKFGGQAHYIGKEIGADIVYTGDPVVITKSWEAGHNGEVVLSIVNDLSTNRGILQINNVQNVKVTGLTFRDIRTAELSPQYSVMVSIYNSGTDPNCAWNIFEGNEIYTAGISTGIGFDGFNILIKDNYYEDPPNESIAGQDPFGGTGGMGTIIDGNRVVLRGNYQAIPNMTANASVTIGNGYLIDTRLNTGVDTNIYKTREDYHVGIDLRVNENWSLIVTSNKDSLFAGSAGWTFAGRGDVADANVTFTSTSMTDGNSTSFTNDAYINTTIYARLGTDTIARMVVTDNVGSTLSGIEWVDENGDPTATPITGTHGYIIGIEADDYPPSGVAWRMEGAHRDGIQFSTIVPNTPATDTLTTIVRNNIIVDEGIRGTGWNGIIYTSDIGAHQRWLIYNNIFVSKQEISSAGIFMYNSQDEGNYPTPVIWESMKFFNNTLIFKGSGLLNSEGRYTGTGFYSLESFDSLEIKNNLFICDTTTASLARYDKPTGYAIDIDYNIYAFDAYNLSQFGFNQTAFQTIAQWRADGLDVNSDTLQSSAVTFEDKYGSLKTDYRTTTGVGLGENLGTAYPYMQLDANGVDRGSSWDIGAVQYGEASTDTMPTFSFTPVTNATRGQTYTATSVFTNVDSTFHVSTTTGASFKVGILSNYATTMVEADSGDTVYVQNTASGSYSTPNMETIKAGGNDQVFTVTTESQPIVPPVSGNTMRLSNGRLLKDSTGKIIRTQ